MDQMAFGEEPLRKKIRSVKENCLILLRERPETRESYKELVWAYWEKFDMEKPLDSITKSLFLHFRLSHPLTIIRCGTKLRVEYPELAPTKPTDEAETIYREEMR